jgi:dTDP-4-amino-4,6-dideoxygalactose transaminase
MTTWRIPFNKATFAGEELELIRRAVEEGHISGDGPFTKRCEAVLAEIVGANRALLTTSCTHALELAALLLGLREGDEVVVPAFTFVSSASAFALRGARPVFVDVRPDTLNLDERLLAEHVGERTRAIVPVHYAGVACAMDEILDAAGHVGAVVVEDNAHGLFGSYRGRPLGSFGALAAQSFHETKNVTCGEGGALILNDPRYVEQAEILREKGTNRTSFLRGQVDKYTWVALGSSYVQSDLLAAFLVAQLEARERIQAARRRIWERYERELAGWAGNHGVRLPVVPEECAPAYHIFHVLMPSLDARTRLIDHLRERGILAVFHYQALHLSSMGRRYGGREGQCPVAEDVADRLLRLPFYTGLGGAEQAEVIEEVLDFDAF